MTAKSSSAAEGRRKVGSDESRKLIAQAHCEVIADLGENAPYIAKSRIYELVAKKVHLSVGHVKNVLVDR